MLQVDRVERGWAGHFICADQCQFRRNTLLTCEDTRIVVSTVGRMLTPWKKGERFYTGQFETVGHDRHFETMAFHAKFDGTFWDADVTQSVDFEANWCLKDVDAELAANDMHEAVVREISGRLASGHTYPQREDD